MKIIEHLKTLLEMLYIIYKHALFEPPPPPKSLTRGEIQEQERQQALRDIEDTKRRRGGEA